MHGRYTNCLYDHRYRQEKNSRNADVIAAFYSYAEQRATFFHSSRTEDMMNP